MKVALGLLLAIASDASASHTPSLTRAEEACQRTLGPATDHFGAAIAACVVRCDAKVARGKAVAADCVAPYGTALTDFLASVDARTHGAGLPSFVVAEFRKFLRCGVLARMAERAAHLVEHVFPPDVPVRQWVLSVPHRLRCGLAYDG